MATIDLSIHLLGRPCVRRDGAAKAGPRSNKAWGVLAYLLLAERAPTRQELVSLLFAEADDPLATLRWNLNALRRLLDGAEIEGDPVVLRLPPGTVVDVLSLRSGEWVEVIELPGLDAGLLAGMSFAGCPAFELWVESERRHLAGTTEAVLREAALARLARADAGGAVALATRLVTSNPLDENYQALLVRALAATGDRAGAAEHARRAQSLLEAHLGIRAESLTAAAEEDGLVRAPLTGPAGARAQLEAGQAAIAAGALDAGLECLRRSVDDARRSGDAALEGHAMLALGAALVHAARGRDEEAAAALHEVLALADQLELTSLAASACYELGYVEYLRGRYDRALPWLDRARGLALDDPVCQGRVATTLGSVLSDTGHYDQALAALGAGRECLEQAGEGRQIAYNLAATGRAHLLCGRLSLAAEALDESLRLAQRENWTALTPWPESLRGDVDLAGGETDAASDRFEHAFALGCQLGDPCWEGIAARGLGLVEVRRGRLDSGLNWLHDARRRSLRLPDGYLWVDAYALDAMCDAAVAHGLSVAAQWVDDLLATAGRTGMREFTVRGLVHRARLGDAAALPVARVTANTMDNPALHALIDRQQAVR